MKNEKWLIAIDLDKTLLPDSDVYPSIEIKEEEIDTLRKLVKLGHKIVITTGRSWVETKKIYEKLDLDIIVANFNGCLIQNPRKDKILFEKKLGYEELKKIIKDPLLRGRILNIVFKYDKKVKLTNFGDFDLFRQFEKTDEIKLEGLNFEQLEQNQNIEEPFNIYLRFKNDDVNFDKDQILKFLEKNYPEKYSYLWWRKENSNISTLEINSEDFNKWNAVLKVAKMYKIKNENIVAIGDNINDFEMIKNVKNSVAMKNAIEKIKTNAIYETSFDNNNNGVSQFLNNFFNLEI